MTARQERQQREATERHEGDVVNDRIGSQVMTALGEPDDLLKVQVRPLWGNHYRVNVLVGPNLLAPRVAYSYFLVADGEGNVVAATPQIRRHYGATEGAS